MHRLILMWACLALAILPARAAEPEQVSFASTVPYEGKAVSLTGELKRPEGAGPFPAVVLMHGCGGLSDAVRHALRKHAQHLVDHGFAALILDSFGPRGNSDGWVCESTGRLLDARFYRRADALAARNYLQSRPFIDADNIFQMGQSNGASVSVQLAQMPKPAFRASVAFYPWCGAFTRFAKRATFTAPLLVLAGTGDGWTPPGACQSIQPKGAEYRIVVYPDAVHSFDLEIPQQTYKGHKVGYDARATEDSRRQMVTFLTSHLTPAAKARLPEPTSVENPVRRFLSGDEITALMPSGKLQGVNGYGNPYTVVYAPDGAMSGVAGRNDEYKDTGKWWVKEGSFCRQYKSWLGGTPACFRVTLEGNAITFFDADGNFVSAGTFNR